MHHLALRFLVTLALALAAPGAAAAEVLFVKGNRAQHIAYESASWKAEDDHLLGSGMNNLLVAQQKLGSGDFTIRARLSLAAVEKSAAAFVLGESHFGFAGAAEEGSPLFVKGKLFHPEDAGKVVHLPGTEGFIPEGKRFDLEIRRAGTKCTVKIAGREVFSQEVDTGTIGKFGFNPGRAKLALYSFVASGNLETPAAETAPNLADLQPKIHKAIDKGAVYLLQRQARDGSWGHREKQYRGGQTALSVYTLMKAGLPREHPAVLKGLRFLDHVQSREVYTVSCMLMAYGEAGFDHHADRIQELVDLLVQWQQFTWGYPFEHHADGWGEQKSRGDLSCTQFAALGLRAAKKAGAKVPEKAWRDLLKGTIFHISGKEDAFVVREGQTGTEEEIHGFGYLGPDSVNGNVSAPTGSMTAAGVACLELCREALGKKLKKRDRKKIDEGVDAGINWLAHYFSVDENPKHTGWHLYYLYGLERVGSLTGREQFGKHWWYFRGAEKLVNTQGNGGNWGDEPSTCFAILFLKRATGPTSDPEPQDVLGFYRSEGEAPIWLQGVGESPMRLTIPYLDRSRLAGNGRDVRVAKVEYLVNGEVVASVRGGGRPWSGEQFSVEHHFRHPGVHEVSARIHVRDLDGNVASHDAEGFEVDVRSLYGHWGGLAADAVARSLIIPANVRTQASSANNDNVVADRAVDGLQSTRWVCAKDDSDPKLTLSFGRPIKANTIILTQSSSMEAERNSRAIVEEVEITVNGDDTHSFDLHSELLRPSVCHLPDLEKIRSLEIRITARRPGPGNNLAAGFAEISLEIDSILPPSVSRDAAGVVHLACPTPETTIHYTLDGSEPTADSPAYTEPFEHPTACTLQARAYDAEGRRSRHVTRFLPEHHGGIALDRSRWRLYSVSSEQPDGSLATKAFDGNRRTWWHTNYQQSKDPYPHDLIVDLRESLVLSGLLYTPRWIGPNGHIKDFEIHVSDDPTSWGGKLAAKGTWAEGRDPKRVDFAKPMRGRYVRLVARSEQAGQHFASASEIDVIATGR